MKYILFFIFVGLISLISVKCYSQKYIRSGNNFTINKTSNKQQPLKTSFTLQGDTIYVSSTGRCFTYKTSKKTGKQYKKYCDKEFSKEICDILGIKYVEDIKGKEAH